MYEMDLHNSLEQEYNRASANTLVIGTSVQKFIVLP